MARYGATLTVAAGKMPSSQSNFNWLLTEDNFPTDAKNGGATSILNGGGNLRCYIDDTKVTQLPVEVVTFVTGATPSIQVWGLSGTLDVGDTVYVEADTVATSQPSASSTYGSEKVWVDYAFALNLDDTSLPPLDSTGNNTLTNEGSPVAGVSGAIGDGVSLSNSGFKIASPSGFSVTSGYTYSFFANIDSAPTQWQSVFRNGGDLTVTAYNGGNVTSFHSGSQASISGATAFWDAGTRHKFDMTWSASDNIFRIYKDAVQIGTVSQTTTPVVSGAITLFYESSSVNIDASIYDQATFRNSATSADYITADYNNQNDPSTFFTASAWEDQDSGVILTVDSGTYATTGTSTPILTQTNTQVLSGLYSTIGTDTPINAQLNIITTAGNYSLTGTDVDLLLARRLLTEAGSYNLTGTSVTLIYTPGGGGEILTIDSGVYSLAGTEVILKADFVATVNTGSYLLNGTPTPILYGSVLTADSGVYSQIGSQLNLLASYGIIAQSTTYSLTGSSVTLKYSGDVSQVIGTVTSVFAADKYSVEYKPNQITVTFKG